MRTKREGNIRMTEGKPMRLLLAFSLPLMFGNVFQQLYTVTDTAIVGRGVGIAALAALGAVDWLSWLPFCIPQGFSQGFSVLASQKYGAGDLTGLRRVVGQSVRVSALVAAVGTVFCVTMIPTALRLLHVREDLKPLAGLYLYILQGGFALAVFYNLAASMLRAIGDSHTPLMAMIVSSVVNIALDALVVFVFRFGIAGAAGATVFAQLLAGFICFRKMMKTPELRFTKADLRRDRELSGRLVRLGLPMSMMNMVICLGGLAVTRVVNGLSIGFIAGYTATNKLYGILEIAAVSYSYAVTTYVGQNYGAGRTDRIRTGVRSGVFLSVLTAAVIGLLMILFGRQILSLFLSREDPGLFETAGTVSYRFLTIMSLMLPVLYILYAYRAALQGMGDTRDPMFSSFIETGVRVGIAVAIAASGRENGILYAEVGAWGGAAVYLAAMYYIRRSALFKKSGEA